MTDEEKISLLALMLGDFPGGSGYYPMFTPEQYAQFLKLGSGSVNLAAVYAATSACFIVSGESSREAIGELQISSSTGTNYLKTLDHLIKTVGKVPPANLMPWIAGLDSCEKNKLLEFSRCDKPGTYLTFSGAPQQECGC